MSRAFRAWMKAILKRGCRKSSATMLPQRASGLWRSRRSSGAKKFSSIFRRRVRQTS